MTKTKISAQIVADSKNEFGDRITSFLLTFPRIILAEFNTHRAFSRNSSSSRAIPFKKMVESVENDPFIPIAWQKDHKGMQGLEYITKESHINDCIDAWLEARDYAVHKSSVLNGDGEVTKQICNRLLEPYMWQTVLMTTTNEGLENFFELRSPQYKVGLAKIPSPTNEVEWRVFRSKNQALAEWNLLNTTDEFWKGANEGQAEIHMMELAEQMWNAYNESKPRLLLSGEWHIPFIDKIDRGKLHAHCIGLDDKPKELVSFTMKKELEMVKISTAMAARTSFTVVGEEKEMDYTKMVGLHDKMKVQKPIHASPFEHCAQSMSPERYLKNPNSRNFRGFIQYREIIE